MANQASDPTTPAPDLEAVARQIEAASAAAAASLSEAAKQIETSSAAAAASLSEAAKQVEAAAEAATAKLLAESVLAQPLEPPILPEAPKLDEYVEDLIDASYGGYSSRKTAAAAADKMLAGFDGLLYKKPDAPTGG